MAVEPKPKPAGEGNKPEDKKDEKREPEVRLTPEVQEHVDEHRRLQLKRDAAAAMGADAAQLAQIDALLKKLGPQLGKAMVAEAAREAAELAKAAARLAEGPQVAAPEPSEDQKRIHEAEQELRRIEDKLAKAAALGVVDATLKPVRDRLPHLREDIGRAAREAAQREAEALKAEIDRIARGLPRPDAGDGKGPGPVPQGGGGGQGGQGGGGGQGGAGGSGGAGADSAQPVAAPAKAPAADPSQTESAKAKAALTIYVRSERSVWAWNRADQAWVPYVFASKLVDVKLISGGILAIAEHEAVLFDCFFGRWLTPLKAGSEELVKGEASTETKPDAKPEKP